MSAEEMGCLVAKAGAWIVAVLAVIKGDVYVIAVLAAAWVLCKMAE